MQSSAPGITAWSRPFSPPDHRRQLYKRGLLVDARQFLRLLTDGRYIDSGRLNSIVSGAGYDAMQEEIAKFSRVDAGVAFARNLQPFDESSRSQSTRYSHDRVAGDAVMTVASNPTPYATKARPPTLAISTM